MKKKKKKFKKKPINLKKRKLQKYKKKRKKNLKTKLKKTKRIVFKRKKRLRNKKKKKKFLKVKSKKKNQKIRTLVSKILSSSDKLKTLLRFNFNLDQLLQKFFQGISNRVSKIKKVIEEEREKQKQNKIRAMEIEKIKARKSLIQLEELALKAKTIELKEEEKLSRERAIDLRRFIREEQAELRKERAEKQRKFLEQIRLEKKIEQFRIREDNEIRQLERYVLSQQRESYEEVKQRIDKIKEKYKLLREQKVDEAIRDRVFQLGIKIEDSDTKETLLEKERLYNEERQKIEYALESFYRSAHSLCFQISKRYIPKNFSLMRCIDKRFETGEIFIKWDDANEDNWLILIYIKNNSPEEGIIIEDKTNPDKNISKEFKSNQVFDASDFMVDSLTALLDRERNKKKVS